MRTALICLLLMSGAARASVCAGLWDMALVARALAEDKMQPEVIARVLGRIYDSPSELNETLAARALADSRSAQIFAQHIKRQCEAQTVRAAPAEI